jgi:hypothetical protein
MGTFDSEHGRNEHDSVFVTLAALYHSFIHGKTSRKRTVCGLHEFNNPVKSFRWTKFAHVLKSGTRISPDARWRHFTTAITSKFKIQS